MPIGVSKSGPQTNPGAGDPEPVARPQYWLEVSDSREWGSGWEPTTTLRVTRCIRRSASMGIDELEMYADYGPRVLAEVDDELTRVEKEVDLAGHWVRLRVPDPDDEAPEDAAITLFVGRIELPAADVAGDQTTDADGDEQPQGRQKWVAYGPGRILQKVKLNESWRQYDTTEPYALDTVEDFNLRGLDPGLAGNRSGGWCDEYVFTFGGASQWNGYQIVDYLLTLIVERRGAGAYDGPSWYLTGETDYLHTIKPRIRMEGVADAWQLLKRVINPRYGLDFVIEPCDYGSGFDIKVFALVPEASSFAGYTGPVNTDLVELNVSDSEKHRVELEYSEVARVDKIRLVGDFCRVAVSVGDTANVSNLAGPLEGAWTQAEETAYEDGDTITGTPTPADHDAARADDRFRDVYQRFEVPRDVSQFNFLGGYANPRFEGDGTLVYESDRYQLDNLATLPALPLEAGVDYTTDPPTNRRRPGQVAEYLAPLVLAYDPVSTRYVPVELLPMARADLPAVAVTALDNSLGFVLKCCPNEVFAANHWAGSAGALLPDPDATGLDWERLVATLALETDHRLAIEQELPPEERAGDGSVMTVHVPIAQFWMAPRYTVVGVDQAGALLRAPSGGVIIRDDRNLLYAMMAGAIARYLQKRVRLSLTAVHSLEGWDTMIGMMVDIRGEQNSLVELKTPVTSVVWEFGEREVVTRMLAGQAER